MKIWLIIAVVTFFITLLISASNIELFGLGILVWLGWIVIFGLIFLSFSLFYYSKTKYLLKNYHNFSSYEVVLDKVLTSYMYRGSVYYTVVINDNGATRNVDTNPYFSSLPMSKFKCEDFNNKKVIGLYDDNMDKFYVIKKVD